MCESEGENDTEVPGKVLVSQTVPTRQAAFKIFVFTLKAIAGH